MKYSISKINDLYKGKYICLSNNYINNKSLLYFKCVKCENIFQRSLFDMMHRKNICKQCYNKSKYDKLINKIKLYDGKCLSESFINTYSKLRFQCKYDHVFDKKYSDIINLGYWCPICSKSNNLSEEICREYFEKLFNKSFPTVRLKNIRSDNGYPLELDGYCSSLNLAFEHQGVHHYKNKFTRKLIDTQRNDYIKQQRCKELGISLIIIPTLFNKTLFSNLKNFIIDECNKFGYDVKDFDITIDHAYKKNITFDKFIECKNVAHSHGGRLVSNQYLGSNVKLEWECENGHRWYQSPYVILNKRHWCRQCGIKK